MNEGMLKTWRGVEAVLHRLTDDGREPDPWVSAHLAEAISSISRGQPNLAALAMVDLPIEARIARHETLDDADALTVADLRAAFEAVRVPGGHPA